MNGIDFLSNMNDIDDDLLLAADQMPIAKKRTNPWVRYAAIAACVCIFAGLGLFTTRSLLQVGKSYNTVVSFALNGVYYEVANLGDYVSYGLISEDSLSRSTVNIQKLTKEDLGEFMGTITLTEDGKTKECKVYHYAAYPDSDSICIIEYGHNDYQVYVMRE